MKISPVFNRNSGRQGTSKMSPFHNLNFYNLNFGHNLNAITRGECILFYFRIAVWSVVNAMSVTSK